MPHTFDDIARGESWSQEFRIRDALNQPVDLTGRVPVFVVRDSTGQRARLVPTGAGASTGGTMQVTPADGLIIVTLTPETTAAIRTAEWTLWLDEKLATADAITWGTISTVRVVTSDG